MPIDKQPETGITETPAAAPTEVAAPAAAPETAITLPSGPQAVTDAAHSVPMTAPAEEPELWIDKADWILLGMIVVLAVLLGSTVATNSEVFQQMATGRLIAHGEYFPGGADPFSFATPADGQPAAWVNHSWLFGLGLYLVHAIAGGVGVIIVKSILVAGVAVLMLATRMRGTNMLALVICMAVGVLTLSIRIHLVQPVLITYLFLAFTMFVLNRAGAFESAGDIEPDAKRSRVLWLLPALFVFWVNLDNWFVLGPIMVGLAWLGLALQRWRGFGSSIPRGLIAKVFAVGLLACVVNPHHIRAFQPPPDLAYLLLRGADKVGLSLPDAITGGGQTMAALQVLDPQMSFAMSPFAPGYTGSAQVGWNVAGICLFVLLGLGALSFAANGLAGATSNGPAPHAGRFVVWLALAALAVVNFRMTSLFAIVATPITAMNLSELVGWYTRPAEAAGAETFWSAPVRMARLLGVPLMLALLALAWLGWLNGPFELGARRHVGWDVQPDPQLRGAAERLAELQKAQPNKEPLHVFNTGLDLPGYCAWYAPGVRCFFDTRFNLHGATAREFVACRLALLDRSKPAKEWAPLLSRHKVDHVGVENPLVAAGVLRFWLDADQWLERYGERKVAIFAWSGGRGRFPTDATLDRWNAEVFGPVAVADRPPAKGTPFPEAHGILERYLLPAPPSPRMLAEIEYRSKYGLFVSESAPRYAQLVFPDLTEALSRLPTAPGAVCDAYVPAAVRQFVRHPPHQMKPPFFFIPDRIAPAMPILMTRLGWQAIAEAPDNERCYHILAEAYIQVRESERYWTGTTPPLRDAMRQGQIMSLLRSAIELDSNDPFLQFSVHNQLHRFYYEQNYVDLSAEHLAAADTILASMRPDDPKQLDEYTKKKKFLEASRVEFDREVKKRKDTFDRLADKKKTLQKVSIALNGRYTQFTKDNKQLPPTSLGLAGLALQLLPEVDPKTLDESEYFAWVQITLDLLFSTGHAREAVDILEQAQANLKRFNLHHKYNILSAAAQGKYDDLRKALADYETALAAETRNAALRCHTLGLMLPPPALGQTYCDFGLLASPDPRSNWWNSVQIWVLTASEYFNAKTLRAIVALEAGQTEEAHRILQELFRDANNRDGFRAFDDYPMAVRYAAYLDIYQKRKAR